MPWFIFVDEVKAELLAMFDESNHPFIRAYIDSIP